MKVMIVGAGGMLGAKLAKTLAAEAVIGDAPITGMTLVDLRAPVAPQAPSSAAAPFPVETLGEDLSQPGAAEKLVAGEPDIVFHLAAIVSGEAEADFEKGYRVNLDGTRALFEAIRLRGAATGYHPRLVYASSLAVFGAPLPPVIGDEQELTPLTSYGVQKAIGELLLDDYTRRGALDGIGLRLPTIVVRPGKPNKAASSFFSSIIREPLAGLPATLPVDESLRHWFASPRAAVGFFRHAAALGGDLLGARRTLTMPGVSATVGEQIAALERAAGADAAALIRRAPDPDVARIVSAWPEAFTAARARRLGFTAETDFDAIVRIHIDDMDAGNVAHD